jgi:hypothetical protein
MSAPTKTSISLAAPEDLIAAVPHMLGFYPENSIVVLFHGAGKSTVELTARSDIPAPEHYGMVARHVLSAVAGSEPGTRPRRSTVILIGGSGSGEGREPLPARALVEVLTRAFSEAGITVAHALWAEAARRDAPWRCYHDPDCSGRVADPGCSVAAATFAVAGSVTYASREELRRLCEPTDPEAMERRVALLEAVADRDERELPAPSASLGVVRETVAAFRGGDAELDDDAVVRLAVALSDHRVRDACLLADSAVDGQAARRLWLTLTREMPPPERAEPACLLACAAYLHGDGALAGIALEAALAADPGHTLSGLIRTAQRSGVSPSQLRGYIARAVTDSRTTIAGGAGT